MNFDPRTAATLVAAPMPARRVRARCLLALSLSLTLSATTAFAAGHDISKVNGSITVDAGEQVGDLDTVNGSIIIGAGARVSDAETVNGSIRVSENVHAKGLSTVNGSIGIGTKVVLGDDVSTVNGSIFVDRGGSIGGGIETVNGAIGVIETNVGGGIQTVGGDVTVGVGSHVSGGIHYAKPGKRWISFGKPKTPRVVIGPNARVDGPLLFEREVELYVHGTARTGAITGATAIRYDGPTPPAR